MTKLADHINIILNELPSNVVLVAVTKTRPVEDMQQAYDCGLRDFGENRVQEMIDKQPQLPADIRWHQIGHLQTNKVKYIAPFVHLIHSVDSLKLLTEINKQALRADRIIDCLLQVFIATEESKFGLDEQEVRDILSSDEFAGLKNIRIRGLMGMATFTDNMEVVRNEFATLKKLFGRIQNEFFSGSSDFYILSMGMSGDYHIAIEEGSTMVRIGSAIFGERH